MAESVTLTVECPATPERIDQCPDTPDRVLNMKSPDSTTSSDTECPINLRTRSTDSPPPNCAICLGRCKNKCFTDSCLHQFCFKCLLEWSKVKAECPLCKQPFNSIIHNVKSIDQFEEYLVAQPEPTSQNIPSVPLPMPPLAHHHPQPHPSHLISSHHHSRSASASAVAVAAAAAAHSLYPHRFDVFLGDYPRFRSELSNGYSTTVQVHPSDNETLQQIFLHRSLLVERLRQQYPDEVIPPGSLGQLWRRYIYDRRLYAMPVVDITGRYRDCSARFFRDNPAQMHRLMAWLNRDVVCLLRESEHHASYVLNVISELLTIFNINSPEFRRRIQPYFRERTAHFIHEFMNFARSPYDMIGYDREVRYSPYYEEVIISSSSSSSGFSDSEDIVQIRGPRRGRTEFTIETRSNSSTFILTGTIEGQTGQVPHSTPRPSGIIEVNHSISTGNVNQLQVLGQSQVIQIDRNIVLSSSSSDECEFVSARKPPHLRTPELISLNSASDSDVVFVSEVIKNRPSEIATGRPGVSTRKRRPPKGVFTSTLSASSSLSSSSESENEEKATTAMSKKKKGLDKFKRETKSTTNAGNSKNNDEYNNGASTSSGLQGSEKALNKPNKMRSGMCCKKYYGRPIRQTTSKRLKNMKSIYEESSSADDSDKTISDESFKCEKSSNSSDSSKVLSKLRQKQQKRKLEHKRRSQKAASSGKKKKSKKSSRKRSKRRKLSSSSSKIRSKRSHRTYTSSSSETSSSSSTSDLCCSSNGWSSSFSE